MIANWVVGGSTTQHKLVALLIILVGITPTDENFNYLLNWLDNTQENALTNRSFPYLIWNNVTLYNRQ